MTRSPSVLLVLLTLLAGPIGLISCGDDDSGNGDQDGGSSPDDGESGSGSDTGGSGGDGSGSAGDNGGADKDGGGSGSSGGEQDGGPNSGSGGTSGGSGGSGSGSTDCDLSIGDKNFELIPNPTGTMTLTSDKVWQLEDVTYVEDGDVLTIEPCTRIEGLPGSGTDVGGTLVITRGGMIMAEGQPDAPILLTSSLPEGEREAGTWGGVVLLGKASNFKGTDTLIEGLADAPENKHGGNDDDDNSGVMTYVRLEFGGYELSEGNEINGLTLGSVGSKTTIHHIMVNSTLDDGFEFFGGTVDASYLVSNNAGDDMFDADQGYRGKLSYLFGRQIETSSSDPNGFEMDSDLAGATPVTYVTVEHVTMCGKGAAGTNTARGMVLRENLTGELDDILVTGFDVGVDVRDDFGTEADPKVTMVNSKFWAQNARDIGAEEPDLPAEMNNPNNDMGFIENDWFDMGTGNEIPNPAPFEVEDCQASGGPNTTVMDSDLGAFTGGSDWLEGMWLSWDIQ